MEGFKTVQDAINSIPSNNNRWTKIHLQSGTYVEQVTIPHDKPCIFLEGEGRKSTIITYNDHSQTDKSATFSSYPPNVIGKGITFQVISRLIALYRAGVVPALAARVYGDKSAFYDCGFVGVQDTLWDAAGRHYFSNCYVEGAVDFIFGRGQSFYEVHVLHSCTCTLHFCLTFHELIASHGRENANDPSGFVFSGGRVEDGAPGVHTLLGRAYRKYSRVIFQSTYLSAAIDPRGWDAWHYAGQEQNFVYVEADCRGPGADKSKRVPWEKNLDPRDPSLLRQFSKEVFVDQDGWIANQPTS
ncbi:unnamed protein product [Linum tenue]|uniref:Pectinesterase n=2 Tax=Linum tenue TaxID=586396 RepID=A0AAV0R3E0_9ROSI|nr:unnamed protein product [Linum tenue]